MTISLRGTATGLAAGTNTNLSFTIPTGSASNDIMFGFFGGKPFSMSLSSGTLSTDYTLIGGIANGLTANNVDVGSVYAQMRYRVHDGSEANPSGSLAAAPSPRMSGMIALQSNVKDPGWDVQGTTAIDSNTGSTQVSLQGGSVTVQDGDWVVLWIVHKTDSAVHSSPALSIGAATISGLTEQLTTNTTLSGNDGAGYLYTAQVATATPVTAQPLFTANVGAATNSDAAAVYAIVREPQVTFVESWGFVQI